MTRQLFSLIPFSTQDAPNLTISGTVERRNNHFSVHYTLTGNLEEIFLPSSATNPSRKDELWRTTCFEFFIAVKGLPQYWEFNMSPSGEWNIYVMDAYRQVNMRQETRIQRLQFKVQNDANCFSLETALDLNPIITEDAPIEAGITSVIQTKDGKESYWALNHPHPEADFHLRNSFVLEFPFPP
jgi:hypothetical protein